LKAINVGADLSLALPLAKHYNEENSSGRVTDAFGVKMFLDDSG
jgi:hypothetical protein